jgi:hypothetical protein
MPRQALRATMWSPNPLKGGGHTIGAKSGGWPVARLQALALTLAATLVGGTFQETRAGQPKTVKNTATRYCAQWRFFL